MNGSKCLNDSCRLDKHQLLLQMAKNSDAYTFPIFIQKISEISQWAISKIISPSRLILEYSWHDATLVH